jgi:hypothetical protein
MTNILSINIYLTHQALGDLFVDRNPSEIDLSKS